MVAFRLLQGVFGAAIVPLSQTFLLDINPKESHGSAMAMWGAGIMVGPIIGPTLGGWLTESYNWRWVFFINLPVGILAFLGCAAYLPSIARRIRGFDFFGFAMLSLGVGALAADARPRRRGRLVLVDRDLDRTRPGAHRLLGLRRPHHDRRAIRSSTRRSSLDRNFATGLVFIFVVGIILLASLALLPPMLSRIFDYPVITTGLVMAPRGVGTMISMLIVGRLVRLVDPRKLVVAGLMLTALSLYYMTGFTPQMDSSPIIITGVIQGLGLGLVFVPLSTVAFATLEPRFRTDAASLFSLVRNIGSSIGISIVSVLLTRNIQVNHAELSAGMTPFNPNLIEAIAAGRGRRPDGACRRSTAWSTSSR